MGFSFRSVVETFQSRPAKPSLQMIQFAALANQRVLYTLSCLLACFAPICPFVKRAL